MKKITTLWENFKEFFNEKADAIAISTGFIKKKRKLKGASFLKVLVLSNMRAKTHSIESIYQLLHEDSVKMTKHRLDFRFSEEAVDFMKGIYREVFDLFKNSLPYFKSL